MKLQLLLLTLIFSLSAFAQQVTTDPTFPTANAAVDIIFDATGTALENYSGDIYAHTGVTIDGVGKWQHVIESWGNNDTQPKLSKLETNKYKLEITESINEFYSVLETEKVIEICVVFRNDESNLQSDDIFITVYEAVLSVSIIKPEKDLLIQGGQNIEIEAAANFADSLKLYVDKELLIATADASIETNITALTTGKHWIWVEAKNATESVYDSVFYYIREEAVVAELPNGVKKGINYINDSTVTLVLHAPEKEFTYLIGDFNNWDLSLVPELSSANPQQVSATTWMMNKTQDGSYHWATITNLNVGEEYAYQYYIDGEVIVADPYTEKVLDPWNDHYISEDTYPGLKAYPEGKTTEPVSVLQTAQQEYNWQATDFQMPAPENMVIYEMLIRDFVATHSYKTIADTLNYLVNLGVNVLELMPVNEFEGNSSWGYNPSFYFAPDKYYGPKEDLKYLIDECHKKGIAVVIDMVLNHSYGQSPLVRMYFENGKPAANNPWYNVNHNFTNSAAQWGYDFNHESEHTKELIDSINAFWMSEYKVDGFRFDFTKGFGNNIKDGSDEWGSKYDADRIALLKRMSDEIWKRNPDAFISFEHLSNNDEETELANYGIHLWGNLNHAYNEGTMGWTESGKSDISWISYQQRGWDNPNVVGYMESHDEERLMFKNTMYGKTEGSYNVKNLNTGLSRIELAANFFLPIPGPKMIWQFGEFGYDISIDENGRVGEKPIKWEYYDNTNRKRIYEVMSALAHLKTSEPAFSTTNFDLDVRNALKSIHLNHTDMNVVILGNFDVLPGSINPEFQNTGTWYEFYSGTEIEVTDTESEISLTAGEYRIYTTKKLETPDIPINVFENNSANSFNVYPNPANNTLFLGSESEIKEVEIYNLSGKLVKQIENYSKKSLNISDLESGLYFILAKDTKNKTYTQKFIKE